MIALVLAALIASIVLLNSSGPKMQVNDSGGDVLVAFGPSFPNAVDMTGATIEETGNNVNCSVLVKEAVSTLNVGQTVTWEITLVYENSTDDVVGAYTLQAVLNATGYSGTITNVESGQTSSCNVNRNGNLISIISSLPEGQTPDKVEWSITSTYEAEEAGELVSNAFDFLPDEGTHTTAFP